MHYIENRGIVLVTLGAPRGKTVSLTETQEWCFGHERTTKGTLPIHCTMNEPE